MAVKTPSQAQWEDLTGKIKASQNRIVDLTNGMTTYTAGNAPMSIPDVMAIIDAGGHVTFRNRPSAAPNDKHLFGVVSCSLAGGVYTMVVARGTSAAYWLVTGDAAGAWSNVEFFQIPNITMRTTDPGEGGTLAANNFIAVYNA